MSKRIIMAALLLPFLTACSSFWMAGNHEKTREGASSSLVDFLYPRGQVPPELPDRMPHLKLPLRVGIAFVPSNSRSDITATEKQELLEQAASAFRDRPYVQSIDAIPETYMRSARGITGMQLGRESILLEVLLNTNGDLGRTQDEYNVDQTSSSQSSTREHTNTF